MSRQVPISDRNLSQTGKRFTFPSVTALQTYMDLILLLRGSTSHRPTSVNLDDSSLSWLTLYDDNDGTPFRVPPIQCHGYWERGSNNADLIDKWESSAIDHVFNFAMADYADSAEILFNFIFIGSVADPGGEFNQSNISYSAELQTPVDDIIVSSLKFGFNRLGSLSSYTALGGQLSYSVTRYAAAYPKAGDFQLSTADLSDYVASSRDLENSVYLRTLSGDQSTNDTRRIKFVLDSLGEFGAGNGEASDVVAYTNIHAQSVAGAGRFF